MRVSRGVTFVTPSEQETRYQEKVNAMEDKMQHMTGLMKHWLAFMSKKFPEEDFINEMEEALHDDEQGYADKGDAATNLRSDTLQTNMRS